MAEDMAARSRRLATEYNGGRPNPGVPAPRAPQRMVAAVPTHTPAQLQAVIARETENQRREMEAAKAAASEMAAGQQGDSFNAALNDLQALTGGQAPTPAPAPKVEEPAALATLSTYDLEVLEMAAKLDPADLILHGRVRTELDIVDGVLSVTVQTLKKSDWTEIHKDVDGFRRGGPVNPGDPESEWITPFPSAVNTFMRLRYLAQGLLGVNAVPYPNSWVDRVALLEDLPDAAYDAILREYDMLLVAVKQLFPDKATKEVLEKLKARLGKAPAHP